MRLLAGAHHRSLVHEYLSYLVGQVSLTPQLAELLDNTSEVGMMMEIVMDQDPRPYLQDPRPYLQDPRPYLQDPRPYIQDPGPTSKSYPAEKLPPSPCSTATCTSGSASKSCQSSTLSV